MHLLLSKQIKNIVNLINLKNVNKYRYYNICFVNINIAIFSLNKRYFNHKILDTSVLNNLVTNKKNDSTLSGDFRSFEVSESTKEISMHNDNSIAKISKPKIDVLKPAKNNEDIEIIAPELRPTFNLAAYADKSEILKHFINLGVEIAQWEKDKEICFHILRMDFEKEIKPYIFFLNDIGIAPNQMSSWFTKNPQVFKQSLENLQVRINYLYSKKFTKENIVTILNKLPKWINFSTIQIDKELGIYQRCFHLTSEEVRRLVVSDPKLIVFTIKNSFHLQRHRLAFKEELGFTKEEMKTILLNTPRLYRTGGKSLVPRFEVVHNEMGLSHEVITKFSNILLTRDSKLNERHEFLKYLGKNQYNPEKPNYVSPTAFVKGSDAEFCLNVAHTSVDIFNDFLKTM